MHLLLVSATPFEIAPTINYFAENFEKVNENSYKLNELTVEVLVTGVGMPYTAYKLGKALAGNEYDLVINAGIAGAYKRELKIGDVVNVISEQFGDLGIEEADGTFTDLFDNQLLQKDNETFTDGKIINPDTTAFAFLPKAKGLTINKVHGFPSSIAATVHKYDPDVESMEGAAFFLVCKEEDVKFLQLRSISNYVEKRNRANWNLPLAIENLNKVLRQILVVLSK